MKRRGGRPRAASRCQPAVNASLPSRLPTSLSAISDGLLFIREKVLFRGRKKPSAEKPSGPKLGTIVLRSGWSFLGFALFPTSRIEVFFSLKGVARHAVRLVLVSDRWESWLSQVADAETKQAMRQHPHLSKFFFQILSAFQGSRCKVTHIPWHIRQK